MGAIAGQFVKFDAVPTRKVVRVVLEMPIEKANDVLRDLGGYPDAANAQWVGVALLNGEPAENTLKGGALAKKAGILCAEGGFRRFMADRIGRPHILSEDETKQEIYRLCGVSSRAHLDHDHAAGKAFRDLELEYTAWRNAA